MEAEEAFLHAPASKQFVRCDDIKSKPMIDMAHKQVADVPAGAPADGYLERSTLQASLEQDARRALNGLKAIQFRSAPGNLIYRASADFPDKEDPTYATGQDLYDTDKGFSFSLSHTLAAAVDGTATKPAKPGSRVYSPSVVGALGVPLCSFFNAGGADCTFGGHVLRANSSADPEKLPYRFSFNIIP